MTRERIIVHVDMDAFFAAVEQRERPALRGRAVVVGADPKGGKGRGVVSTCSYEAREFGIRSAMPISEAWRRCPDAVYLPVNGALYARESRRIRAILESFTPDIEPVSIDEAFLDVTHSLHLFARTKRELAERIQQRVCDETQLTCSLGVAPSKLVAKIASDLEKPRGIVVVEPEEVEAFLRPLPVGRLWGVGEKTRAALEALGVRTIGDLAALPEGELSRRFGKHGEHLWKLACGIDHREVEEGGPAKSVGHEHTFPTDTADRRLIAATLADLCEQVAQRLHRAGLRGRTVTLKLRFQDFTTLTRARTLDHPVADAATLYETASASLERVKARGRKVRLIGVSVSGFGPGRPRQPELFDTDESQREARRRQLGDAIGRIKDRFGHDALHHGTALDRPADTDDGPEGQGASGRDA